MAAVEGNENVSSSQELRTGLINMKELNKVGDFATFPAEKPKIKRKSPKNRNLDRFRDRLEKPLLICKGGAAAIGTQENKEVRGKPRKRCPDRRKPEK